MSARKPAHVLWRRRTHSSCWGISPAPACYGLCVRMSAMCAWVIEEKILVVLAVMCCSVWGLETKPNPRSSGSAEIHLSRWTTSPAPPKIIFNTNPKQNQKQSSVSLCSPRCPRTHGPLASASQMPALQCCYHMKLGRHQSLDISYTLNGSIFWAACC